MSGEDRWIVVLDETVRPHRYLVIDPPLRGVKAKGWVIAHAADEPSARRIATALNRVERP